MKYKSHLIVLGLVAFSVVLTAIAYSGLPPVVPIHWNFHGQANGYAPKWILFLILPGVAILYFLYPMLSPKRFAIESFKSTYLYIMVLVATFMTYLQCLVIWGSLGHRLDIGPAILGGICLLFVLLGNVMGKVRRNFYLGIRTPWSLANEQVWNATHRFAARTYFATGIIGFVLIVSGSQFWLPLGFVLCGGLAPIAYSCFVYYFARNRRSLGAEHQ